MDSPRDKPHQRSNSGCRPNHYLCLTSTQASTQYYSRSRQASHSSPALTPTTRNISKRQSRKRSPTRVSHWSSYSSPVPPTTISTQRNGMAGQAEKKPPREKLHTLRTDKSTPRS